MIVFGAIAPHAGIVFEGQAEPTRAALEELGRRFEQAAPDASVVFTPHNVHVDGAFAVVSAATVAGALDELDVRLSLPVDRELAAAVLGELRGAGLPGVGVSYGSNDPALAEHPLDWGALIPLWFMGGRSAPERPVVVISPCREWSLDEHVAAGAAVARACESRRVAVLASADHGHRHDADGPFGFDEASAEYDERMVALVRENRLGEALLLGPLAGPAYADSLWQVLMLHGALGSGFDADLLSYEAPTYFGMLCAAFTRTA